MAWGKVINPYTKVVWKVEMKNNCSLKMMASQETFQISSLFRSPYLLLFSLSLLHTTYLRLRFSPTSDASKLLKVPCNLSFTKQNPIYQWAFSLKTHLGSHSFYIAFHYQTYFIGLERIVLGSLEIKAVRIYLLGFWSENICVCCKRCKKYEITVSVVGWDPWNNQT